MGINMQLIKMVGKFVIPMVSAVTAFTSDIEYQKQKELIADLVKRVSELEKK